MERSGPEQPGDYSYDLVHEVNLGSEAQPRQVPEPPHHSPPAHAGTDDTGGDYEYDEAHDF
jgi:hypothetical protein